MRRTQKMVLAALAIALSVTMAACGSGTSGDDSSEGSTNASGQTAPPKKTIGYVDFAATVGVLPQAFEAFKSGADALGWEVKRSDANRDGTKALQAAQLFVTQKVDAIVFAAVPPQAVFSAVRQAKAAGIPTIAIVNSSKDSNYDAQYTYDIAGDDAIAPLIDTLKKDLPAGSEVGVAQVAVLTEPTGLLPILKTKLDDAGFKLVQTIDGGTTDQQTGFQTGIASMVRKHPNLKAVIDVIGLASYDVVGLENGNASKDVRLYSYSATSYSVPLLVQPNSRLTAIVDPAYSETGLIALDQLVNLWGPEKTPLPKKVTTSDTAIVTADSLPDFLKKDPESNEPVIPSAELVKPHLALWAKTFDLGS